MEIDNYLKKLISKKVIKSTTGGGAGSILKVEIDSNCDFLIYCAWRIENDDNVLSTSEDDGEAIVGRMARSAKMLETHAITSICISPQKDLTILFEDNYCLRVFCNMSYSNTENGGTYDTNWELGVPEEDLYFKVNNYFKIETGKYY